MTGPAGKTTAIDTSVLLSTTCCRRICQDLAQRMKSGKDEIARFQENERPVLSQHRSLASNSRIAFAGICNYYAGSFCDLLRLLQHLQETCPHFQTFMSHRSCMAGRRSVYFLPELKSHHGCLFDRHWMLDTPAEKPQENIDLMVQSTRTNLEGSKQP